jgi:hypothetical protein
MLFILIALILAALVWIVIKPAWLPKPPENQVTTSISKNALTAADAAKSFKGTAVATSESWLNRVKGPFQKQSDMGKHLKAWANEADLAKKSALYKSLPEEASGFAAWLANLSDTQAAHFANGLAAFCRSQNMELVWLFDAKAEPETKDALDGVVVLYSLAAWKGHMAQPLASFQAWQAAPQKGENRVFGHKLYIKLVEAGLLKPSAEMMLASEKERQAHIIQAIQGAAAQNRPAVLALVAEIYAEGETAARQKAHAPKKAKKQAAPVSQAPVSEPAEVTA